MNSLVRTRPTRMAACLFGVLCAIAVTPAPVARAEESPKLPHLRAPDGRAVDLVAPKGGAIALIFYSSECPISNAYVTSGSKSEAIKAMLDKGMRVTVNSDDPAYFPGYMNENLLRVQKEVGLSRAELAKLAENAFSSAWLPPARAEAYLAELRSYAG